MFGLGGMATKWAGHAFFCGVYFFWANKQAPNIFAHKNGVHCGAGLRRLHTRAAGPGEANLVSGIVQIALGSAGSAVSAGSAG